jgi:hypothetical protein
MLRSLVIFLGLVIGLFFLALAALYFLVPANALPHFMPGYDPAESKIHITHALGFLVIAIVSFAMSWFRSWATSA